MDSANSNPGLVDIKRDQDAIGIPAFMIPFSAH
jgi:hypothetical protein